MLTLNGQFNIDTNVVRGDKSMCHRALIFASVASGQSIIHNLTLSRDVLATVNCLRALGAKITITGNAATVEPITKPVDNAVLNCENSGTTARLLAGLVAGLNVKAKFVGDASLTQRPMDRVIEPLTKLGANFRKIEDGLFESLGGKLHGERIASNVNSAQVKSAVLIAGLFGEGETTYVETLQTRNHTELMLRHSGASISMGPFTTTVSKSVIKPLNIHIPNDPSSMAFLIGLALICNKQIVCPNTLLNDYRIGFLRTLKRSCADIGFDNVRCVAGERIGDIVVNNSRLQPLFANPTDVCDSIDELPILAAIALTIKGKHVFQGVSELKYKESDRISAIVNTAIICGQKARFDGNNLTIESNGKLPKNPRFKSFGDHRIAMAQAVLCLASGGGMVDNAPFEVSFPEFLIALGITPLKLGLVGSDIANSRSPVLMEYLSAQAKVSCSYDTVSLARAARDCELIDVVERYDGLNVTMPFKTRVANLLKSDCSSVNTIGKHIKPQSTDGYGIVKALLDCNVEFANKPLWIVGAGGAAQSCVEALLEHGCKMQIINRTQSHADELTSKYGLSADITEPYGVLSFVPECEFEQSIALPPSCKFVFVADYKGQSGLKRQALKRRVTYVDGLRMLYHQGAKSFSLWTNTPLQEDYDGFEQFLKSATRDV